MVVKGEGIAGNVTGRQAGGAERSCVLLAGACSLGHHMCVDCMAHGGAGLQTEEGKRQRARMRRHSCTWWARQRNAGRKPPKHCPPCLLPSQVKAAEPVLSVGLSQLILGENNPYYVWLSLLPIIAGCSLAAMKEVRGRGARVVVVACECTCLCAMCVGVGVRERARACWQQAHWSLGMP